MSTYTEQIGPDAIRITRRLPGPIDRVWSHLVESELRAKWICAGDVEQRVGGRVEMSFDHEQLSPKEDVAPPPKYADMPKKTAFDGTVTKCEPPRLLEHTWAGPDEDSLVEFALEEDGDHVMLTITHTRIPSRFHRVGASSGWHVHLDILGEVLEGKTPEAFWRRYTPIDAEYEARIDA